MQEHENSLNCTRREASNDLCIQYLDEIYSESQKLVNIFLAFDDSEFAGFICYYIVHDDAIPKINDSNNFAYVSDICVLKKHKEKGIAKLLFEAVENYLREKQYQGRIRLCSLANNQLANNFYLNYGFKPYEIAYQKEFN